MRQKLASHSRRAFLTPPFAVLISLLLSSQVQVAMIGR